MINEILPNPLEGVLESEGEWFELVAIAGGELGGTTLSDGDGGPDFVFPQGEAAPGEILVVANGQTAPPAAAPGARIFLAGKTSWTLDDEGDDLAVIAPDGAVEDHLSYGLGPAVDSVTSSQANESRIPEAPPRGASVGRLAAAVQFLIPTPGGPNRRLALAGDGAVRLGGFLRVGEEAAALFCAASNVGFSPYLWTLHWGRQTLRIADFTQASSPCLSLGASSAEPWGAQASELFGSQFHSFASDERLPWVDGARVELLDPMGTLAISSALPETATHADRSAELLTPCSCEAGWLARALWTIPPSMPLRRVGDVEVVRAGAELERAVSSLFSNASRTLDVNAYLMTAGSVEEALRQAGRRGVSVRLLLEGAPVGTPAESTALGEAALQAFNSSGVWVRKFNSSAPNPARDHAKYAVADGRSIVVLTENFVGSALSAKTPNVGFAVFLHSDALGSDIEAVFSSDFARGRDLTPAQSPPRLAVPPVNDSSQWSASAAVLLSPGVTTGPWVEAIRAAKTNVEITSLSADAPTMGPASQIGGALIAACRRGADIRILFPSAFEDDANSTSLATARALSAAAHCTHLEVRLLQSSGQGEALLHAKLLVIDGVRLILGSHNLVAPAFETNRELSLIVEDAGAARELEAAFAAEFAKGSPVLATSLDLGPEAALGSTDEGPGDAPGVSGSFALLVLGGGVVTAAAHFRGLRRGRRERRRVPFWRRGDGTAETPPTPDAPADPVAIALTPPDDGAVEFDPSDEPAFEVRVAPPVRDDPPMRPPRVLPPTAFDLFEDH